MLAAEGLARSAERHSMPHCSLLLATCFFPPTILAGLSEPDRTKIPPRCPTNSCQNSSIGRLPPPAVNCRRVAPTVPKRQKAFCVTFPCTLLFQTKLGVIYIGFSFSHRWLGLNKQDKRHLRKSAWGGERGCWRLQLTVRPLCAGHICFASDKRSAVRSRRIREKKEKGQRVSQNSGCVRASTLAHCSAPTTTNSKDWRGHSSSDPLRADDDEWEKSRIRNKESGQ